MTTYNLMHTFVKAIVLAQYQQNDQRHINMMRRTVRCIVKCL